MATKQDIQSIKDLIASLTPAQGSSPSSLPTLGRTDTSAAKDKAPMPPSTSAPSSSTPLGYITSLPMRTSLSALPLPLPPSLIADGDSANLRRLLPQPQKFSKFFADYDFTLWLTSMQEYLTLARFPQCQWALIASYFLDQAPLRPWQSHKAQLLTVGNNDVYKWDYFKH